MQFQVLLCLLVAAATPIIGTPLLGFDSLQLRHAPRPSPSPPSRHNLTGTAMPSARPSLKPHSIFWCLRRRNSLAGQRSGSDMITAAGPVVGNLVPSWLIWAGRGGGSGAWSCSSGPGEVECQEHVCVFLGGLRCSGSQQCRRRCGSGLFV